MKKLSIEYAHIYTNQNIDQEHIVSLQALGKATDQFDKPEYSLVVMVDDYSFPDPSFDYQGFIRRLEENGYAADVIIRESQLIPYCDEVLKHVKTKKRKQLNQYITTKKKYPCSLFIATRYLIRLGAIQCTLYDTSYIGEKLLSILPRSFEPFEDQGLSIIKSSTFSNMSNKITVQYFNGRGI